MDQPQQLLWSLTAWRLGQTMFGHRAFSREAVTWFGLDDRGAIVLRQKWSRG
jgi:hypothetical protein